MAHTEIRPAVNADRDSWRLLRQELWPDCPAQRHALEIQQILASEGVAFVADWRQAGIVGFAEVSIRRDHVEGAASSPVPYLEGWFVREGFRRQGIGRRLLDAASQWAAQRGFSELASDAEIRNEASISVHAALGFREVGRSVHFLRLLQSENVRTQNCPLARTDEVQGTQ